MQENKWQDNLEKYRNYLKMLAHIYMTGQDHRRWDSSDLVQETLVKVEKAISQCKAQDEQGRMAWMKKVLVNTFLNMRRDDRAQKRDARLETSFTTLP